MGRRFELSGIYKITNKVNGKFYVGSAYSIFYRWYNHTNNLKQNKHTNYKLQRAFNKYGFDNFIFEIVELHLPENLNIREQYYLDTLCKSKEYIENKSTYFATQTYNIKPKVEGIVGLPNELETRIKINRSKGFSRILKVDLSGNIITVYELICQAAEDNTIHRTTVSRSIQNKSALKEKNFGFVYEQDYFDGYIPLEPKPHNKGIKNVVKVPQLYIPIYCYDIYGRYFCSFESVSSAANYFNTNLSNISRRKDNAKTKIVQRDGVNLYNFFSEKQPQATGAIDEFLSKSSNGNISVHTLFHEHVGDFSDKTIAEILGTYVSSVRTSVKRGTILKGFYFTEEIIK